MNSIAEAVAAERAAKRARVEARAHFATLSALSALGSRSAPLLPTPLASAPAEVSSLTDFFLIVLFDRR